MRPPLDLHIHSTYSDGTCTVEEIVALASQRGMQVIALSDHDTTDGLKPIRKALLNLASTDRAIRLIPAIEMSSGDNGLTHVLGYGVRQGSVPLENELTELRRKRIERTRQTIALLHRLTGVSLSEAFLQQADASDRTIGRVHVARQMIAKHMVQSIEEAFRRYLGVGKPAFVPLQHLETQDVIFALRKSGIVPILAHPMRSGLQGEELAHHILRLKDAGLMGVEVFHPSASSQDVKHLYAVARKYDLLVTGGSDFHGDRSMRTRIGEYPSGWETWQQDIAALQEAISAAGIG